MIKNCFLQKLLILSVIIFLFGIGSPLEVVLGFTRSDVIEEQIDDTLDCTFICNLIDDRANDVGIKGTDLGVGLERDDEIWLIFGDVVGTNIFNNGASAVALLPRDRFF